MAGSEAGEPTDSGPGDTASLEDTADPSALVAPTPSFDAAGVEAEADGLIAAALPDATSLLRHWRLLFEGAGPPCPAITGPYSIAAPFDGCLASDGRIWAGFAVYAESASAGVDIELGADATITGTDGLTFLAAGEVSLTLDPEGAFTSMVVGTWGGAASGDWTDRESSVGFWAVGDPHSADIFGGISVDNRAVYVDELHWDEVLCPGATGRVRVRDPGGWWYSIALDADCGGCGEVTYDDVPIGQVCLDLGQAVAEMVAQTEQPL